MILHSGPLVSQNYRFRSFLMASCWIRSDYHKPSHARCVEALSKLLLSDVSQCSLLDVARLSQAFHMRAMLWPSHSYFFYTSLIAFVGYSATVTSLSHAPHVEEPVFESPNLEVSELCLLDIGLGLWTFHMPSHAFTCFHMQSTLD